MKYKHKNTVMAAIAFATLFAPANPIFAQDFGFDAPAAADGEVPAAMGTNPLVFSGELGGFLRSLVDTEDPVESAYETRSSAELSVKASLPGAEGFLALMVDPASLLSDPGRAVEQAWAGVYAGPLSVRLGLQKITWGKGDDVHVLDVINPFDYGDFINRPYAERKIAQMTLKLDLATSDSGKLEFAYLPVFGADRTLTEGPWAMKRVTDMLGTAHDQIYAQTYAGLVEQALTLARLTAYNQALTATAGNTVAAAIAAASITLDVVEAGAPGTIAGLQAQAERMAGDTLSGFIVQPDMNSFDMGQAGLRYTETLGGFDFGLQYWYGFLRDPVYDADPVAIAAAGNHVVLDYNRVHRFGADFAFALAGFNFRAEMAYDMTGDYSGDDALVRNPAFGWSAGVDREFLGFRLNVQNLGRYTLFTDQITDAYDVEDGIEALSDTVIADLSRSMMDDKLVVRVSGIYSVENADYAVMPSVEWSPADNATLKLKGSLFRGDENGTYGQFADNSFVEASLTVAF